MDKKLITLTELVIFTCIPKRTLYRMIKDGRFPIQPIKGSNPRRWNVEEVESWLKGGKND